MIQYQAKSQDISNYYIELKFILVLKRNVLLTLLCSAVLYICIFSLFQAFNPIPSKRPSSPVANVLSSRRWIPRKFAHACSTCRIKRKTFMNYGSIALQQACGTRTVRQFLLSFAFLNLYNFFIIFHYEPLI